MHLVLYAAALAYAVGDGVTEPPTPPPSPIVPPPTPAPAADGCHQGTSQAPNTCLSVNAAGDNNNQCGIELTNLNELVGCGKAECVDPVCSPGTPSGYCYCSEYLRDAPVTHTGVRKGYKTATIVLGVLLGLCLVYWVWPRDAITGRLKFGWGSSGLFPRTYD